MKKNRAVQSQMRTISYSKKEINDEKEINTELFKFYKPIFEPKIIISNELIQDYLNCMKILKLAKVQSQRFEGVITEFELLKALKKVPNNKSLGKDEITKKKSGSIWRYLKTTLLSSVIKAFKVGKLSCFQKQTII